MGLLDASTGNLKKANGGVSKNNVLISNVLHQIVGVEIRSQYRNVKS
jgi:hypothetical protein